MITMMKRVTDFIRENTMLQQGDTVVAGVSGGADSVCLLFLLKELRSELSLNLQAAHIHHGIRREADEDETYVQQLCKQWEIPLTCVREDVQAYAKRRHISTEEAGREVRYRVFRKTLERAGAPEGKIAVAHNQNDNAETVLFHLLRGSGLTGLSGISPVRNNIIRPLLCVGRAEIEAFLNEKNISFCIDHTNNEDTYTRNRIRHHILPVAEQEVCAGAIQHIYDMSVRVRGAQDYLRENADRVLLACCKMQAGKLVLDVKACRAQHPFLLGEMLMLALERMAGCRKDFTAAHVEMVRDLLLKEGNRQCDLPYAIAARREYDRLVLEKKKEEQEKHAPLAQTLNVPGEMLLADGRRLICEVFPSEGLKNRNIPEKRYTKWFDYDKIIRCPVLRTRQIGDYLVTCRSGGKKSLKAWMIDEKIPRAQREELLLLADGSHIIWVIGSRISEFYKIDKNTKNVLQIRIMGGTSDGGENQGIADRGRCGCQNQGDW